jgi:hypothetical protein
MTQLPAPRTDRPIGDPSREVFVHALHLGAMAEDYARVVRNLVSEVTSREDPYRGGEAEALLAIAGARDVERIAVALAQMPLLPDFFRDLLREQRNTFLQANPNLKAARDVIEHVDEYMFARGRMQEHWFDLTSRFDDGIYLLRVGGSLDIDMMRMAAESEVLASVVAKVATVWLDLEGKMTAAEELASPFLQAGITVTVRFADAASDSAGASESST